MAKPPESTEQPPPAKGGKKRLILIAAAAVLLLGGGAAGAYVMGFFGKADAAAHPDADAGHGAGEPAAADPHAAAAGHGPAAVPATMFVDMPDMVVNLQANAARMRFLKLRLALEVDGEAAAQAVKGVMPRVQDSFQLYLRALTVEDVAGPGGMQRLKEDLAARANIAAAPTRIADVLVKEMLVQ